MYIQSKCSVKYVQMEHVSPLLFCSQVPGKLVVTVHSTKKEFESKKTEFIRKMSKMLNAIVIIVSIEEIPIDDNPTKRRKRRAAINTK